MAASAIPHQCGEPLVPLVSPQNRPFAFRPNTLIKKTKRTWLFVNIPGLIFQTPSPPPPGPLSPIDRWLLRHISAARRLSPGAVLLTYFTVVLYQVVVIALHVRHGLIIVHNKGLIMCRDTFFALL